MNNNPKMINNNKIELLAPAGDFSCFLAAISAGADAVYLSGEKYGARAYAKNFTKEELVKAIDYAHIFGRKVFLTVNTLVKDDELNELFDYLLPYYEAGLDGVIVQDMGVISYIQRCFKDLPVHASTQMAITGLEGIKFLDNQGIKRTVLAREVSLDEIKYIKANSEMELETFVHGALCYSYSGKCLFSSLAGGRSGNRGRCAGSCRQPYNDKYLLSTKDICCLSILPDLIEAGIASLKIEGRMKSPEYVAGVTSMYRKYIDIYYANINNISSTDIKKSYFSGRKFLKDLDVLTRLYTRGGNSTGYYYNRNGRDMITIEDASYKSDKGEVKQSVAESYLSQFEKIKIRGHVSVYPGQKISILINDEYYYEGSEALVATNRPIDEATVIKQINKTKDTEFEFTEITTDISEKAFVRISDLNELRRDALISYRESLLTNYRRNNADFSVKASCVNVNNNNIYAEGKTAINCEVNTLEQLEAVLGTRLVDGVYVPFGLAIMNKEVISSLAENTDIMLYLKFQSVIRDNFLEKNKKNILSVIQYFDGVLCDSHEVLEFLKAIDYCKSIIGDIHVYALNNEAALKYKDAGFSRLTVPVELNKKELLSRGIISEELIVYGYLPMMVSAQCVNKTCNGCDKAKKEIKLTDRKGMTFTAVNYCDTCTNIIYNNVPLSLHSEADFIFKIKPASIRLSFSLEDGKRISEIIRLYRKILDGEKPNTTEVFKENSYTKGHLSRGVL